MRPGALVWISAVLLCGCPGEPVEGSGGAEGGSTSTDASVTNTVTIGSQTASDSTDGGMSMSVSATETGVDPTSATLEDTGSATTAADTVAETMGDTTSAESTSLSAGSSTTEAACDEPDEPNQTEDAPLGLAEIACQTTAMVDAVAEDITTPDWFAYHGAYETLACGALPEDYAEPRVTVVAGAVVQVCAYVTCIDASEVFCMAGVADTSPLGLAGCCAETDAHLLVNCPTPDEDTDVLVRVDTTGSECSGYTLELGF